ncbi:tRNA uridine-5-carboxymethylaminomethyl(34) synthesis GTPase MnmE [Novosphingobium sp.]|uniref:tRNA uridine-5-carboxymethylaminomethyl(34) synthesis GTPase MnmE n=1 Tax=Novosphingobium sp. TaxID=1874826 RepID=UPI0022C01147|nr:tRNA uridine-5-carboxymethylaminomethyl(34) synthesis GTPase MnmE [Novosphingobium sp.]MCZ8018943.1 tRNA uridine-5-carboxymethylaminomethyl(34) synthesis GTPase MnmE [Novosphingobium sp.]MCZ8034549.1 tRNA uridine-5-carboxymethylaminomethyl(34) synthesis GTPase MnmE [Novosphingobium sp.]MCZ8052097.1 tRNA uridine-5-carboxymethylaminomethyl(34) synthesis GTPase MnmE [Novosphingobium sp.]MCZ8060023.1 tRNA uridine-5-carboxymethylaminomethyl(34) synthesis GTPase MnmE [Novosphingobium sp.]MCZ82309
MTDTIFALSSGAPPAAIAVVRISGPAAGAALAALVGRVPPERRAVAATLRNGAGEVLDRALVLWLPGPGTATGEDTAELHLHGGRAVVAAVSAALAAVPGLRAAEPGEFTRRAFANGRIDLAEAEGLADLLSAETELQRRSAIAMAGGALSRRVEDWRERLLSLSASVEAVLDFADEDDVATLPADFLTRIDALRAELAAWLARPRAEVLREGFRVVIAGPPNAGKSTLFNALVQDEAAIATPIAGTTRDVLTRPVGYDGVPFLFADTAGLHDATDDVVEAIGIERALEALDRADLVLWLGPEGQGPAGAWEIAAQCDRAGVPPKLHPRHRISAVTGLGMAELIADLVATARQALPKPGEAALNERQHHMLRDAARALHSAEDEGDPLLVAESLRLARVSFDGLLGRTTTEDMLDALFGRFCIGK